MTTRPQTTPAGSLFSTRREQLRRAVEDGERLYRKRMHDSDGTGLTIEEEFRADGILTRELESALALVDECIAEIERIGSECDAWEKHGQEATFARERSEFRLQQLLACWDMSRDVLGPEWNAIAVHIEGLR